jgi:hypothetical protein
MHKDDFQDRMFQKIRDLSEVELQRIIKKGHGEGLSFDDIEALFTPGMDGKTLADKIEARNKK